MRKMILSLIIFVSLFISSCYVAPHEVYLMRLVPPNQENSLWLNGKELKKLSTENAELIVNYETCRNGYLIFNLSIANRSDKIMLISPTDYFILYRNRLKEAYRENAKDPEKMILNMDKRIERLNAENASENRTELLFSLFDIVGDFQKQTPEEREKRNESQRERVESHENTIDHNNNSIRSLSEYRDSISRVALRKTTLMPGQMMSGNLYFASGYNIRNLTLYLPVDQDTLLVNFKPVKQ